MNIKQKIEANPVVWFLSAIILAFGVGFGTYKTILEVVKLDTVQKGSYILKSELEDSFIEWDSLRHQYVLMKNKDKIVEKLGKEQIEELHNLDSITRSLIDERFRRLQTLAAMDFEKKLLPKILQDSFDMLPMFLKDQTIVYSHEDQERLKNWFAGVIVTIILQREKEFKGLITKEDEKLNVVKDSAARWVLPNTRNVAILNMREIWHEYILTEFDLLLENSKNFLEREWVPVFTDKVLENSKVTYDLKKADPIARERILLKILELTFFEVDKRYKELTEQIKKQRQMTIEVSEALFLSLLLGEIESSEYGLRIKKAVLESKRRIMEKREELKAF